MRLAVVKVLRVRGLMEEPLHLMLDADVFLSCVATVFYGCEFHGVRDGGCCSLGCLLVFQVWIIAHLDLRLWDLILLHNLLLLYESDSPITLHLLIVFHHF